MVLGLAQPTGSADPGRVLQTAMFLVGITLFAAGASMYMTAALGNAPYDAIAPIVVDHTHLPYRVVRVARTSRSWRWPWRSTDKSASAP